MENLKIIERIAAVAENNLRYQNGLANTYGGLSSLLTLMGDNAHALECRLKSLTIREQVAALDEENMDYKEGLATAYDALSNLYSEIGDLGKSLIFRRPHLLAPQKLQAGSFPTVSAMFLNRPVRSTRM